MSAHIPLASCWHSYVHADCATCQKAVYVLQSMETYWLADTSFVAGNKISIADLLYSCELEEMCLLDSVAQVRLCTFLCACISSELQKMGALLTNVCLESNKSNRQLNSWQRAHTL